MRSFNASRTTALSLLLFILLPAVPASAEYVELGSGGNLLMNVPFCGG